MAINAINFIVFNIFDIMMVINNDRNKFSKYLSTIAMINNKNQNKIHFERERDQERTIYIDNLDISPTKFDLNSNDKQSLIDSGRRAVNHFLQLKNNRNSIFLF